MLCSQKNPDVRGYILIFPITYRVCIDFHGLSCCCSPLDGEELLLLHRAIFHLKIFYYVFILQPRIIGFFIYWVTLGIKNDNFVELLI